MMMLCQQLTNERQFIVVYIYMEFNSLCLFQQEAYQSGKNEGQQQSNQRSFDDIVKQWKEFGTQYGIELAKYHAYIDVIEEHKISKSVKVSREVEQFRKIIAQNTYQNLQHIKLYRQSLRKKFNTIMSMIGLAKVSVKNGEQNCDF